MKTFTDKLEREWKLEMTIGVADEIRERYGIDVLHPEQMTDDGRVKFYAELIDEPTNLFEVIGFMVDSQAPPDMTDREFRAGLTADVVAAATLAFYEELEHFFVVLGRPDRARIMETVRTNLTKGWAIAEKQIAKEAKKINMQAAFDKLISQTAGK